MHCAVNIRVEVVKLENAIELEEPRAEPALQPARID